MHQAENLSPIAVDKAVAQYLKNRDYRKAYALRPEVKAKRKAYNKARWLKIKQLLSDNG